MWRNRGWYARSMSRRIRTAIDNPEFEAEVNEWIAQDVMQGLYSAAYEEADRLAGKYEVNRDLVVVALAGEVHKFTRSFVAWMAAEARYNKHTLQEIADALQYASNSHVKRAHPQLDEIVEVLQRVQETKVEERVSIHGKDVILMPVD